MLKADLVVEGFLDKQIFPKSPVTEAGSFAIFVLYVGKIISGSVDDRVKNKWYQEGYVTFKGSVPELRGGTKYKIAADVVEDPKYGCGYQIKAMNVSADLSDEFGMRKFLSYVLTDKQVDALFSMYPDPKEILENHRIDALCKIKGIKRVTAEKILNKYDNSKDNSEAYAVLYDYGLTKYMIDKLVDRYKSAQTLIEKVTRNPYILIDECDGIGWAKADSMALSAGIKKDSDFRVCAYIKYYLKNLAETDGHTWVPLDTLVANAKGLSSTITNEQLKVLFKKLLEDKQLYYDRENRRIGLMRYRTLEENIYKELLRLRDAGCGRKIQCIDETIKECECSVGYEYTDEQKDAIRKICESNVCLLTALAGCVDRDTEFFNGETWKKICEYQPGDLVLQYNADGSASLTEPLMYIKRPCETLYHFETKYGVNQTISDDHNVVYWTPNGVKKSCTVSDIIKEQQSLTGGFCGRFKTSFFYDGPGIDLTDAQIKIMCAVICDGSFYKKVENNQSAGSYMRCRFHIKKERKKEELRSIFKEAQIQWREVESAAQGYTDFYIDAPRREKFFTSYWYRCNNHQLKIICDNIMFWDGNINLSQYGVKRKRFSTANRATADFVQFAYSACGYRAKIIERNRSGKKYFTCGKTYTRKSAEYSVVVTERDMVGICADIRPDHHKTEIKPVRSKDGFKYCFMVESTMLVLRCNDHIFVTGNCGKSSLMYPVTRILRKNNMTFSQCTLSGKASLNLRQLTEEDGKTIHRLLAYDPARERFMYDKDCKLPDDAIILDEVSMVGGELFYSLIQAIKTGAKLIMIGDPGQLESIGLCNLISDLVNSQAISHASLTKIFRQAAMSGIITDSVKVYHQQPILSKGVSGVVVHGELKDFEIDIVDDSDVCAHEVISAYKDLCFTKKISPEDVVVVTAKRCVGQLSAVELNKRIQALFDFGDGGITKDYTDGNTKYQICYHVGDRIIVTKNNYTSLNVNGMPEPIYNGNIGTVVSVDEKEGELIVRLPQGDIPLTRSELSNVQLGYAITCAKSQGSGFKYVIAVCDPSSVIMLTKEYLYTAITRAKKWCRLIGTWFSVNKCIQTTRVIAKQTWLLGLLAGYDSVQEQ